MRSGQSAPVASARGGKRLGKRAAPSGNGSRRGGRIPRHRKPAELSLEAWQIALRRQLGLQEKYRVRNIGDHPVFSEYQVINPATGRTYRVAIRGHALGDNFCSCPDFTVNTLGTCKHVESLLERMRKNRETRKLLEAGFQSDYSEIYVHYGPSTRPSGSRTGGPEPRGA